jgi:8-oxo-dGTP pyrophosphatase MutT (NUDIX family)
MIPGGKMTDRFDLLDHLSEEQIRDRLRHLQPDPLILEMEGESYRPAAVLMPLLRQGDAWQLLFIRRTETVQDHKGQVAFPGGSWEKSDTSLEMTALRETNEEIGAAIPEIRILGNLGKMKLVTHFQIAAYVGTIPAQLALKAEPAEVSRIFTIPLRWLADPENREERDHYHQNWHRVIYYQPYDGEVLWGASAALTVRLIDALMQ